MRILSLALIGLLLSISAKAKQELVPTKQELSPEVARLYKATSYEEAWRTMHFETLHSTLGEVGFKEDPPGLFIKASVRSKISSCITHASMVFLLGLCKKDRPKACLLSLNLGKIKQAELLIASGCVEEFLVKNIRNWLN